MAKADRLIEIFTEAKARTADGERERFLAEACPGDPELKEQVVSLLQSHEGVGDFLKNTIFPPTVLVTEKPGDVIGRYKLLEKLGEGGCGVVYVAEQTEPVRRRVALKVIKLGMDTKQVVARFEAERQALAMMDHPNIAKVFDAGATDAPLHEHGPLTPSLSPSAGERVSVRTGEGSSTRHPSLITSSGRPYFVMELVRGIRITDYCDQNNLSTKERLDLFIKVCQAIQHAHQKGIIHRDIKPSNILVTMHDETPVPKVIDFGIAKATEGRLADATVYTQLHQFIGTPAYMSPEQAEMSGLDIDTRSDIYSLGVLLYELLTGKTPFDAQRLMASGLDAMRKTIRETEPVRPSTRLTQESAAVDLIPAKPAGGLGIPSEAEATAQSRAKLRLKEQINRVRGDLDWIAMKCLEKDRTRRYETANGLAADLNRHLNNEPVIARPPSAAYKFQKAWRRNKLAFTAATAVAIALLLGTTVSTWLAVKARTAQRGLEAEKITAQYNLYVANINLAGKAWGENNIDQLRRVLDETRTFPDRGFEWYYWQRQAHLNLSTLRGHLKAVRSVAFSPNGQRIVTGSDDHTARVWDAATGRQLFMLVGHTSGVVSVAFSRDGQFIVTGSDDRSARVWDATNQREVLTHLEHKEGITGVAFSPDGLRIATASYDGTAKVWDAKSGRKLLTFQGHMSNVLSVAFSPNGKRIVTGSEDRTARVWDAATGREILTIKGHIGSVLSVAFSPDGQRVLTGSGDKIARVWDAVSGKRLLVLPTHGPVGGLDISRDGRRIVTGSWDSTASVWDAVNGDNLLTIRADSKAVMSVAFSPDGERIVTGGGGEIAQVWELSAVRESLLIQENGWPALAVAISPQGDRIITAGGPDGVSLSDGDQPAQLWESTGGKKLFALNGHKSGITSVAFSPNGLWIVTGGVDQTARLWKTSTREHVRTFPGHSGTVSSVGFSPDSQRIVTGGEDGTAKVWEVATGRKLFDLVGHKKAVTSAAFSPNGQWIATGSLDETATLWNASTGIGRRTLESTDLGRVQCVAFSPDSKRLVAGGWPRTALIWDLATDRILPLIGHLSPVSAVAFSENGRRIVTASWDRSAKLWDANTGRELLTLNRNGEILSAVALSRDGLRIVTGDMSRTACVWQAARPEQVATWEAEENAAAKSRDQWRRELDALLGEHRAQ